MSPALLVLCLDHQEPRVMLWALEKSPQAAELSSTAPPPLHFSGCLPLFSFFFFLASVLTLRKEAGWDMAF